MTAGRSLKVLIAGTIAGDLIQRPDGSLNFSYADGYAFVPLSTAMPLGNHRYGDKVVRPFLFGLLPDDAQVRRDAARRFGVSGDNPFDLLKHVGRDCPGAVQFCEEGELDALLSREGSLDPVSDEDIARRLSGRSRRLAGAWVDQGEHWSLGGQQAKFALRRIGGAWFRCLGSAATTHIFKSGIEHLEYQALNEFVCMRLAEKCGISTAHVQYRTFDDMSALVIERYDRFVDENGAVIRLHQEDFCQALGILPDNKYVEFGGPSARDVIGVLKHASPSPRAVRSNVILFMGMLFFNYLVGAPDAHAKNYSMVLGADGAVTLSPLYDVASMLPYLRSHEKMRVAMSIGGENRIGHVGRHAIERFARSNGLQDIGIDEDMCLDVMRHLAEAVSEEVGRVFDEHSEIADIIVLRSRMEQPIKDHCQRTLAQL